MQITFSYMILWNCKYLINFPLCKKINHQIFVIYHDICSKFKTEQSIKPKGYIFNQFKRFSPFFNKYFFLVVLGLPYKCN